MKSKYKLTKKLIYEMAGVLLFAVILFFKSGESPPQIEDYRLERNPPGESSSEITVTATTEGFKEDIELSVPAREYSTDELFALYKEAQAVIVKEMLGNNTSLKNVTENLNFSVELPDYPFEVNFYGYNRDYISPEGEILTNDSFMEEITIAAFTDNFREEFAVKITVNPSLAVKGQVLARKIKAFVEGGDNTLEYASLPSEIDEIPLNYSIKHEKRNPLFLFLGISVCLLLFFAAQKDELKEAEARKELILSEYPFVIQKMSLYLAAGMTIRNIWIKIVEESNKTLPIYEEMNITANELQSGVPEMKAYLSFAERTKVPEIVRFAALLTQNLKKGSTKLNELLEREAEEAFETRKRKAKKMGEEAGTKLLLPMGLLLLDVMLIIMRPAFRSM